MRRCAWQMPQQLRERNKVNMAISDLQMGLVGAGIAAVLGVLVYNKWQERKAQKHAEQTFRSDHRDVLLEPGMGAAGAMDDESEIREPVTTQDMPADVGAGAAFVEAGRKAPPLPDGVDERVDCVLRFESIEPLMAAHVWAAQGDPLIGLSKPVNWFAFDDGHNAWVGIGQHSGGGHHWFCAAMQLVDRRGPINESDFSRFTDGVQQVADHFMAIPSSLPTRAETLQQAVDLDQFCAGVDIQVGVNLVSRAAPFTGAKLRRLVEAQGMRLRADGMFHAQDESDNSLFVLGNLEPTFFTDDAMGELKTQGLTLIVDVPRVPDGGPVFDRMMHVARLLADALDADLVDDNRNPLGADSAQLIRQQIGQFQQQMNDYGVPAGSPLALRLFAA